MIASLLSPLSPSSSSSSSQPQPQKGRISQSLPSVKCSTCHQPVPLTELGEHTCKPAPPVPEIQKPSMSPAAATSLLPDRLQGRVANSNSVVSSPAQSPPKTSDSSQHQRFPSSASARLRQNIGLNAPKSPTAQSFKSSPLARSESENNMSFSAPKPLADPARARTLSNATPGSTIQAPPNARPSISDIPPNGPPRTGTPLSNPPRGPPPSNPMPPNPPSRMGTPGPPMRNGTPGPPPRNGTPGPPMRNGTPGPPPPNNLSRGPPPPPTMTYNNGPPPPQPPGINFPPRPGPPGTPLPPPNNRGAPPPSVMPPPHAMDPGPRPPIPIGPGSIIGSPNESPIPPDQACVPPAERGIDTKSGGAAGMAGVGRRGFAAAARAAMLVQQGPFRPPPATGFPPYPPQPFYAGRPGAPQFLDIDAASRSTETPPLSAGSGYSSHSPGPSSPLPQTEFMSQPLPPKILRTPSPSTGLSSPSTGLSSAPTQSLSSTKPKLTATIPTPEINSPSDNTSDTKDTSSSPGGIMSALSPLSGRLPFFEKFKNKIPNASNAYDTTEQSSSSNSRSNSNRSIDRSRGNTSSLSRGREAQEPSLYNPAVARSLSSSTSASAYTSASARRRPEPKPQRSPPSPIDSESEYGGLAYADSTDYEDNDEEEAFAKMRKGRDDPPTLPPGSRTMRSGSNASADSSRIGFSSVSGLSDRDRDHEIGRDRLRDRHGGRDRDERSTERGSEASSHRGDLRLGKAATPRPGHHRDHSVESSYSSASSVRGGRGQEILARSRSNSSAVAQALGLSQTPPSEYGRLGGPGVTGGRPRRDERSGSVSSNGSAKRAGIIAGRDDVGSSDRRERERERDREWERMERERREPEVSRDPLSKSASQRSRGGSDSSNLRRMDTNSSDNSRVSESSRRKDPRDLALNLTNLKLNGTYRDDERTANPGLSKPYRSNTIQSPVSPESKPIKLPTRSLTSPLADRDKALDSSRNKTPKAPTVNTATAKTPRTAVPKIKICLKCDKRVDDGRWVSVDSGGVLCERCWKNMYLPKCRRCNLPIEKQAISSSDGQLKGKYHKDCFNCHICHKPFPDKTFYVYDGKPLCAYHYHEANDSLCSAARCGQPIEGPCAVSHTGDRYHPEHMTCEYEGRGGAGYRACDVRLKEYWEMDGRMLCEQHARGMSKRTRGGNNSRDDRGWGSRSGSETGSATDDEERWAQNSRAMRRVTRFIDLGNEGNGLR